MPPFQGQLVLKLALVLHVLLCLILTPTALTRLFRYARDSYLSLRPELAGATKDTAVAEEWVSKISIALARLSYFASDDRARPLLPGSLLFLWA